MSKAVIGQSFSSEEIVFLGERIVDFSFEKLTEEEQDTVAAIQADTEAYDALKDSMRSYLRRLAVRELSQCDRLQALFDGAEDTELEAIG